MKCVAVLNSGIRKDLTEKTFERRSEGRKKEPHRIPGFQAPKWEPVSCDQETAQNQACLE